MVDREWNFGEPELWNYGLNVLLLDTSGLDEYNRESGAELDYNDEGADGAVPYVRAFQVSDEIWKQLAFGSVKTHPIDVYLEELRALKNKSRPTLSDGRFTVNFVTDL